jgi:colicin import membrane protein
MTKGRWRAIALSLLVHALIVAAAVLGWFTWKHEPPPQTVAVEGTLVDPRELRGIDKLPEAAPEPPAPEPEPVPEPVPEPEPEPEPEPPPPEEQGPPKPDPEVLKRQEEERLAAEKLAQQKQAEELKAREDAERLEAEKQAAAKAAEKAAAEKKKAEDAAAARKEAEEKARRAAQEELRRSLEAEERGNAARSSVEANRWHASIVAKIARAWNKPPSAVVGMTCIVKVSQVPGGEVTSVTVDSCNPNEAALRQSVENAVLAASPLPTPPPGVPFERNLELTFAPDR